MSNAEQPKTIQSISEILKHCSDGKMPAVESMVPIKHATSLRGTIATIKKDMIGVKFPGVKWETWFRESYNDDDRSKYLRQLILVSSSPVQGVEEVAVKFDQDSFKLDEKEAVSEWMNDEKDHDEMEASAVEFGFKKGCAVGIKWQASRSKGVGMQWYKQIKVIHWDSSKPEYRKSPLFKSKEDAEIFSFTIEHRYDVVDGSEEVLSESAPLSDNSQEEGEMFTREQMDGLKCQLEFINGKSFMQINMPDEDSEMSFVVKHSGRKAFYSLDMKEVEELRIFIAKHIQTYNESLSASPGSEEHRCPYCNSMNVKSSFVSGNHRGNDVDIEIYGCTDCKKEFTDLDLKNTPGSEGKEEKKHIKQSHCCLVCGQEFTDPYALEAHEYKQHGTHR